MASYPVFEIRRIVVLLHAGSLATGNAMPVAFTDAYGAGELESMVKRHVEAGARVIYDGPPNRSRGDNDA